jgi:hypothetical protein
MEIVEVTRVVCGPYFPPDRGPREVSGGFGLRDRHAVPERLLGRDRELVPEADPLRACGGPQPRRRRAHNEGCRRKGVRQGSHHPAQQHQSPCTDASRHFFSKFRSRHERSCVSIARYLTAALKGTWWSLGRTRRASSTARDAAHAVTGCRRAGRLAPSCHFPAMRVCARACPS